MPEARFISVKVSQDLLDRFDELWPMREAKSYFVTRVLEIVVAHGEEAERIAQDAASAILDELD